MKLTETFANIKESLYDFIGDENPLSWKKLGSIFLLIDLIFSPNSLSFISLSILPKPRRDINSNKIPKILQESITNEYILNKFWEYSFLLSMVQVSIIGEKECFLKHESQQHSDIIFNKMLLRLVQIFSSLSELNNHLIIDVVHLPHVFSNCILVERVDQHLLMTYILNLQSTAYPSICLIGVFLV